MALKTIKPLKMLLAAALGAYCAGLATAHPVTIYRQSLAGADAITEAGWSALAVSDVTGKTVDVSGYTLQTGVSGQRYVFFAPHLGRGSDACKSGAGGTTSFRLVVGHFLLGRVRLL